jgi:L-cysteine S-thiosulfotransferase
MTRMRIWAIAGCAALAMVCSADAADMAKPKIPLPADGSAGSYKSEPVTKSEYKDKKSAYAYLAPETKAMQDDDFSNPASLWLDAGDRLWTKAEGGAGKSCGSCHGAAANLRGVGNTYPKISKDTGKLATIEDQINYCRTERMKAPALKLETQDMVGLSMFVMFQSRGLPMSVAVDGAAKPDFDAGKKLYYTRRGQLNLACNQCHEDHAGGMLRSDPLSGGYSNGFPLYRLAWQKAGSFDFRMEQCYAQVRATPEPFGSEELKKLQLYVAWRSNGLPVETPAVRR